MASRFLAAFGGFFVAAFATGAAGQYVDETQCFGGTVPTTPQGAVASATVGTVKGNYVVTAWRQPCTASPALGVLILHLQAASGAPSVSGLDMRVRQSGLTYEGLALVKNPSAASSADSQQLGALTNVYVIVHQTGGARFDANGMLGITFSDFTVGGQTLSLPAAEGASPSASVDVRQGNLTDMWWNPNENGTGLSIVQHGSNQLFIVWYTYTVSGDPLWLVWPGGNWTDPDTFAGFFYQTRGTSFTQPWDPSRFVAGAPYGSGQLRFTAADRVELTFTIGGATATKAYTRQGF